MTYEAGLAHDPENEELKYGLRRASDEFDKIPSVDEMNEMIARAVTDPELRAIMADPVIRQLIDECSNPGEVAAHLKNAGVAAAKVRKLVDYGMIQR